MYDCLIIGAGPAGLSAGIYVARSNMKTLIFERENTGGQITKTNIIENYPGTRTDITGVELSNEMLKQAEYFGAEIISEEVVEVQLKGDVKKVITDKNTYDGKTVIIATGTHNRKIGCKGEDEFTGKGVAYCATCDGPFFQDLDVYVVGGGDAAVEEAIYLTKFARKVTVIHRKNELRAAKSIQDEAFSNKKIDFILNSEIVEFSGKDMLSSFKLKDLNTNKIREIEKDKDDFALGVFVFIGYDPNTELFKDELNLEKGYIKVNKNMETEIPGVFAAGDVVYKSVRQVITAASDGVIAAIYAGKYVDK